MNDSKAYTLCDVCDKSTLSSHMIYCWGFLVCPACDPNRVHDLSIMK